jgi:uncharacterized glyoxalase superfamily protein PhnB
MVEDLAETVDWYSRVFEADLVATLPEEESWWAQIEIGDASLMLQERSSLTEKIPALTNEEIGGSVAFYLDVDDAEGLRDDLDGAGVELVRDLHETDFGWRQFAAEECNGYVLWFGEKLDDQEALDVGRRHRSLVRRHHG